jgi:Domain of unknown function (DUF4270)
MKNFFKILSLSIGFAFFTSCEEEFNTLDTDLIGDEHYDYDKIELTDTDLKAYSLPTGNVQTNNLPLNPFGIYENPYFGKTTASFVTQCSLPQVATNFGTNVEIESAYLYVPYFSTLKSTEEDGDNIYELDSIFTDVADYETKKFRLNIYENGFFYSSTNPLDDSDIAKYYNDFGPTIHAARKGNDGSGNAVNNGARLNDDTSVSQNDQFFFSKSEIKIYRTKFVNGVVVYVDANDVPLTNQIDESVRVVKERLVPGMYLKLNSQYIKKRILQANANDLYNNNAFRSYFRGLYFQAEEIGSTGGAMAFINFNNGKILLNYNSISPSATEATSKTYTISLGTNGSGNTISLQDNNFTNVFTSGLAAQDVSNGQNSRLFLKGAEGAVTYIEIDQNKINQLKQNNWMINDAYLTFYVDQPAMANNQIIEPERIYLYDAKNNKPIVDFVTDGSSGGTAKSAKLVYGGFLEREVTGDKKGLKYKIRITGHLNNILNSTNTNLNENVRLGLAVTESVTVNNSFFLKNNLPVTNYNLIPLSAIYAAQTGTVLHGTASTEQNKKLKLTIHYTKPN